MRNGIPDEDHRGHADERDEPVRGAPAQRLPEPGRAGDAEDVRDGDAEHHPADSPPRLPTDGEVDGHEGRDTEEGAVGQARQEARSDQGGVVGGGSAQHVADREGRHEPDEEHLAGPRRAENGEEGSADDHTGGVRRDRVAGRGDVDTDTGRDVGQQAHRHELGGADGHATEDQGDGREGGVAGWWHWTCSARRSPRHSLPVPRLTRCGCLR